MISLLQELLDIQLELKSFVVKATTPSTLEALDALENSAKAVGRAWSGSWIGYQAHVYYDNLQPPPPGRHFSSEWGFMYDTNGNWQEFDPEIVKMEIEERANQPDIKPAIEFARIGEELFDDRRDQVVSVLEAIKSQHNISFLNDLLEQTKKINITTEREIIANSRPQQGATRDSLAISQGFWTPPHILTLAKIIALRNPIEANKYLVSIVEKAISHMKRITKEPLKTHEGRNRIFIGHGHSHVWKDLKDFIQDRLNLSWDEFNRVPAAGVTTISRLSEMLDSASFAFLVMTAEEERSDGKMLARMNIIHEAGLFQGRLGFTKAIVLLEEGCEEFSNIQGLGQIRFPKGDVMASFEKIRLVLEREGIL